MLRFAPSPTGPLHLGGLRTAFINYLYARKLGGNLILRIEDTDQARFVPGSLEDIQKGLEWAGIHYDYGPERDGPTGPYFQSCRLDLYRHFASRLLESNQAYRCFCSPDELNKIRARLSASGSVSTYDRTCTRLTEDDVIRRLRLGHKNVVRFNLTNESTPNTIDDLIFGHVGNKRTSLPTDPILLKSDGFPTYHLASVVDDHVMKITHVIRGEEWLPSLALHLDLNAALGFKPPVFAHLPILLNPDGSKMSKRHGDIRVSDYIDRGWEPDAVKIWLLSAGWKGFNQNGSKSDVFTNFVSSTASTNSLQTFELSKYSHRRAILDPSLLEHLNKSHLRTKDVSALATRNLTHFRTRFPNQEISVYKLSRIIELMIGRCATVSDIVAYAPFFFVEPTLNSPKSLELRKTIPDNFYASALYSLRLTSNKSSSPPDWLKHSKLQSISPRKHYWSSLRHALTGQQNGPPLVDIFAILGPAEVLRRVELALSYE